MNSKNTIVPDQYFGPAVFWAALLVVCTTAWSFRLVSFLHAKDLALALGVPVALLWQHRKGQLTWQGFHRLLPLWAGLLYWQVSGLFTAEVYSYYIENLLRWTLILVAASLCLEAFRFRNGRLWLYWIFIGSAALVGTLALLQYAGLVNFLFPVYPGYDQRAYSVFGNQNLLGGWMAFNLVLLVSLHVPGQSRGLFRGLPYACVFALLLGALIISTTRSAWLAALAGLLILAITPGGLLRLRRALRKGRRFTLLLAVMAVLVLSVSAPLLMERTARTLSEADVGGQSRLWFWAGAADMVRARPWFGAGLGQFGYWSPLHQGNVLWAPGGEGYYFNELHTVHAHSEPLEWLAETGLFGMLFWGWFLFRAARKRNPALPALAVLAVFACFNTFSHSTPHILAVCLLAAAPVPPGRGGRVPGIPAFLCASLLAASFLCAVIIPSALLCRAEQAHVAGQPRESFYKDALSWPWPIPRAHESYAIALMDVERYDEAIYHLQLARRGIDTGRIHLLLAMAAAARGEDEAALYHARECLARWPGNAYAWALALERSPEEQRPQWLQARQRFLGDAE